ncbi:hypothetical protein CWS43_01675 [Rahnella sp. AA]|nr:hypothetical protein CWS43_01675 [Rahnella sp. AA]
MVGKRRGESCAFCLLYPSYFISQMRWLHSVTRITYLSKLIGIPSLAAFLRTELFGYNVWAFFQKAKNCVC